MDCDHGGAIRDYLARYLASGPVAIHGCCESACTLALGWPETCVSANARLGPATREAVAHFQSARGLFVDGVAGPKTWAAIRAETASGG